MSSPPPLPPRQAECSPPAWTLQFADKKRQHAGPEGRPDSTQQLWAMPEHVVVEYSFQACVQHRAQLPKTSATAQSSVPRLRLPYIFKSVHWRTKPCALPIPCGPSVSYGAIFCAVEGTAPPARANAAVAAALAVPLTFQGPHFLFPRRLSRQQSFCCLQPWQAPQRGRAGYLRESPL